MTNLETISNDIIKRQLAERIVGKRKCESMAHVKDVMMSGFERQVVPGISDFPYAAVEEIRIAYERYADSVVSDPSPVESDVEVYVNSLTVAELRAIDGFLDTPAGVKMTKLGAENIKVTAELGEAIAQKHAPEFESAVDRIVKKYQL